MEMENINNIVRKENTDLNLEESCCSNNLLPITERWDPLGANDNDDNNEQNNLLENQLNNYELNNSCIEMETIHNHQTTSIDGIGGGGGDSFRIKSLEDEQEMLTTSLLALTSHFAQVQFRLRQIVEAEPNQRDNLLKNLEEFAFRGIPEITNNEEVLNNDSDIDNQTKNLLEDARQKQFEVIDRLKQQLTDLEKFAYESGAPVLPQSIVVEKQKIIIDELKSKLNLNVNDIDLPNLTTEDLRNQVDTAIGEFIGPLKMKEQLVTQLKTQITDLERFIAYLQCDSDNNATQIKSVNFDQVIHNYSNYNDQNTFPESSCSSSVNTNTDISNETKLLENLPYNSYSAKKKAAAAARSKLTLKNTNEIEIINDLNEIDTKKDSNIIKNVIESQPTTNSATLNQKAHNFLDKATAILQIFAISQFGCGSLNQFHKNSLKKTQWGNHWGDLRAQLELDVQELIGLMITMKKEQENIDDLKKSSQSYKKCDKQQLLLLPNNNNNNTLIQNQPKAINSKSYENGIINKNQFTENLNDFSSKNQQSATSLPTSYTLSMTNVELTTIVRRNFALTLQKLIQHGLRADHNPTNNLIVPFIGCFTGSNSSHNDDSRSNRHNDYMRYHQYKNFQNDNKNVDDDGDDDDNDGDGNRSNHSSNASSSSADNYDEEFQQNSRQMHAWQLILAYYSIKNGESYNDTPARRLAQSFNLDIVGSQAISNKQSLLSAIGNIIAIHSPYKRSYNSHFKAFVCAALNSHKLVQWLNLLFQCTDLINNYYEPWSYVSRTGFRDALRTIDCLTKYDFDLPIDLAIRQFENIKDVFM